MHCLFPLQLVLPPCLLDGGLPHLLRLSASYRDVSCEDLSEVTWEQLARKLGLVAEVRVCAWRGRSGSLPGRSSSLLGCLSCWLVASAEVLLAQVGGVVHQT